MDPGNISTGIDLSKILGGQTKILGGKKVVKSDKCMGDSQLMGGTCPGCPPKSTPMATIECFSTNLFVRQSILISCSPTEPYPSLHHVFGMTYHLNSAPFLQGLYRYLAFFFYWPLASQENENRKYPKTEPLVTVTLPTIKRWPIFKFLLSVKEFVMS